MALARCAAMPNPPTLEGTTSHSITPLAAPNRLHGRVLLLATAGRMTNAAAIGQRWAGSQGSVDYAASCIDETGTQPRVRGEYNLLPNTLSTKTGLAVLALGARLGAPLVANTREAQV